MNFADLNWFDVEAYLQQDDRLIVILGACEQHGYLSLLTDVKIPLALAEAAGQITGVLIAPPLNFGCSPYFLAYPGTLSLRLSTMLDIAEDILRSAYGHGFKRCLFLNGHGGNDPVRLRLFELLNELPQMHLAWYSWWQSQSVLNIAQKYLLKPSHANWLENFRFTRVAELPSQEKTPPHVPGIINAERARQVYGDGSFGGPYHADPEVMDEIFNAALGDVLHLLAFN